MSRIENELGDPREKRENQEELTQQLEEIDKINDDILRKYKELITRLETRQAKQDKLDKAAISAEDLLLM